MMLTPWERSGDLTQLAGLAWCVGTLRRRKKRNILVRICEQLKKKNNNSRHDANVPFLVDSDYAKPHTDIHCPKLIIACSSQGEGRSASTAAAVRSRGVLYIPPSSKCVRMHDDA